MVQFSMAFTRFDGPLPFISPACGPYGLCSCTSLGLVTQGTVLCTGGFLNFPTLPANVTYLLLDNNEMITDIPLSHLPPTLTFFQAANNSLSAVPQPASPLLDLAELTLTVRLTISNPYGH